MQTKHLVGLFIAAALAIIVAGELKHYKDARAANRPPVSAPGRFIGEMPTALYRKGPVKWAKVVEGKRKMPIPAGYEHVGQAGAQVEVTLTFTAQLRALIDAQVMPVDIVYNYARCGGFELQTEGGGYIPGVDETYKGYVRLSGAFAGSPVVLESYSDPAQWRGFSQWYTVNVEIGPLVLAKVTATGAYVWFATENSIRTSTCQGNTITEYVIAGPPTPPAADSWSLLGTDATATSIGGENATTDAVAYEFQAMQASFVHGSHTYTWERLAAPDERSAYLAEVAGSTVETSWWDWDGGSAAAGPAPWDWETEWPTYGTKHPILYAIAHYEADVDTLDATVDTAPHAGVRGKTLATYFSDLGQRGMEGYVGTNGCARQIAGVGETVEAPILLSGTRSEYGEDIALTPTLAVTPDPVTLPCYDTQQFAALYGDGSTADVNWDVVQGAGGGTITGAGLYTGSGTAGSYTVRAISISFPAVSDTADVTTYKTLTVSPKLNPDGSGLWLPEDHTGCVNPGLHAKEFTALLIGFLSDEVTWTIDGDDLSGDYGVMLGNTYYAPDGIPPTHVGLPAEGTVVIRATSVEDASYTDSAGLQVVHCDITLAPITAALGFGGQQQYTETVRGHTDDSVVWSADAGTVASGLYTAPAASGTYTITATSVQHSPLSGTAEAVVSLSVAVTPETARLIANRTQQFAAVVTGGITGAVTWSASGGSVSTAGLYTAGAAGTYTVTATSDEDATESDYGTVTVYIPIPWARCTNGRMCLALLRTLVARDMTQANLLPEDLNAGDLTDLLNESYVEAVRQARCFVREASVTLVAGTALYALPTDAIGARVVTCRGIKLVEATPAQLGIPSIGWRSETGWPTHYYIYDGRYLGLYPTPHRAGTATTEWFVVPVSGAPSGGVEILTADADVPKIRPISAHMLLVHGAVERLCTRRYAALKTAQARAKAARGDWDYLMGELVRWAEVRVDHRPLPPGGVTLKRTRA